MWGYRLPVYIVPAEQAVFAKVYGKFVTSLGPMWASAPTTKRGGFRSETDSTVS